jgi:glycosyltransferase involved in cell wall biosynthesis
MAIHIEKGDIKGLAEALIYLYENPDIMQKMGADGRQLVIEKYTWGKLARSLYHDIEALS